MPFILIAVLIAGIVLLFYIGGKVRDNIVIDKASNEILIDVNDAVIFLGKNKNKTHLNGIMFLTNRRILFYKHRFDWFNIIPFLGEAISGIFIDKKVEVIIPIHQIKFYNFQPKVTYHNNRPSEENGFTTFYTVGLEEYAFDIYSLGLYKGDVPEILKKLEGVLKSQDDPNSQNPN